MSNSAHVRASFYLIFDTDLTEEEFQNKYSHETIVGSNVTITFPDGSLHTANFASLEDLKMECFEEERATDGKISDPVET